MAEAINDYDGGSHGTTITTGNSGGASGNPWDEVEIGTGAVCEYSNTKAYQGGMAAKCSTGSTAGRSMMTYRTTIGTITQDIWGRAYLYLTANPTNQFYIVRARKAADQCCSLEINTNGTVDSKDKNFNTRDTSPSAIPLNQWVRLEWKFRFNDGNGHIEAWLYEDPKAAVGSHTWSISDTASDCRTDADRYDVGVVNSIANVNTFYLDGVEWDSSGDGSFNNIGPLATPAQTVSPTGLASAEAFGTTTVTGGQAAFTLSPSAIGSQEAIGTASVSAPIENVFDGGTHGTQITVGNSGGLSGHAWDAVDVGTGGTVEYSNTQARSGLSAKFATAGTSVNPRVWWDSADTPNHTLFTDNLYGRLYYFTPAATPTKNIRILLARKDGSARESIQHRTTGKLRIENGAFATIVESANALPNGQWVRIEWKIFYDTSGSCELRIYHDANSTTATETLTGNADFNADANEYAFGHTLANTDHPVIYLDDIAMRTNDWLGPVVHPDAIGTQETFGSPTIFSGISPTGIESQQTVPSPTVTAAAITVSPLGIPSGESSGVPFVVLNQLFPLGIPSQENVGTPALTVSTLFATGIATQEAFGTPEVRTTINPPSVAPLEAFGVPRISLVNEYADSPWNGLTLIDVHSPEGSGYFSVSIADVNETSFGNITPYQGERGSIFTLRFEWSSGRAGVVPFPTLAVVSMRLPGTTTQLGSATWTMAAADGFTGTTGVLTRTCHFDDDPLDSDPSTPRAGRIEMHLYLEHKTGTTIQWACSSAGFSGGVAPLPFNFAKGHLEGTTSDLTPTGIGSGEAFGTAALTATRTLSLTGIASRETFGTVHINPQGIFVFVPPIDSEEAFGELTARGPNHFLTLSVRAKGRSVLTRTRMRLKRKLVTPVPGSAVAVTKTSRKRSHRVDTRVKARGIFNVPFSRSLGGGGGTTVIVKKILGMFGD